MMSSSQKNQKCMKQFIGTEEAWTEDKKVKTDIRGAGGIN